MKMMRLIARWLLIYSASFLGSFCSFGLSLALLWTLSRSSSSYMLATSLISASIGFFAGGIIFSWIHGTFTLPAVGLFGFLVGGLGALYILGQVLAALGLAVGCAFFTIMGGFVYQRLIHPLRTRRDQGPS